MGTEPRRTWVKAVRSLICFCEAQVKEVLQKYLDDEDDLKDLHLSARSALILNVPTSPQSLCLACDHWHHQLHACPLPEGGE